MTRWIIEGFDSLEPTMSPLTVSLPEKRVMALLQWMAARHLTDRDLVNAADPKSALLEPRISRGKAYAITVGENPAYTARRGPYKPRQKVA
jgi:hypothetical protein